MFWRKKKKKTGEKSITTGNLNWLVSVIDKVTTPFAVKRSKQVKFFTSAYTILIVLVLALMVSAELHSAPIFSWVFPSTIIATVFICPLRTFALNNENREWNDNFFDESRRVRDYFTESKFYRFVHVTKAMVENNNMNSEFMSRLKEEAAYFFQ